MIAMRLRFLDNYWHDFAIQQRFDGCMFRIVEGMEESRCLIGISDAGGPIKLPVVMRQ